MATFIERVMRIGDYEEDGGHVDLDMFRTGLVLLQRGLIDAAYIKDLLGCTVPQGGDMDEILGLMPASTPPELAETARMCWITEVYEILRAGLMQWVGFELEGDVRSALGLA